MMTQLRRERCEVSRSRIAQLVNQRWGGYEWIVVGDQGLYRRLRVLLSSNRDRGWFLAHFDQLVSRKKIQYLFGKDCD